MSNRQKLRKVFGDFQTPPALADRMTAVLALQGLRPRSMVEPSCGMGAFLEAGLRRLKTIERAMGVEINDSYLAEARERTNGVGAGAKVELHCADFFRFPWADELKKLPQPVLLLGNPPWVTSAGVGVLDGDNLPEKTNLIGLTGLDARTGKSNFDIAEWLVLRLVEAVQGRESTLAMLVKTHVARRCFLQLFKDGTPLRKCQIIEFDAAAEFGVAANACLFVIELGGSSRNAECEVRSLDDPSRIQRMIAIRDGTIVSDAGCYDALSSLLADPPNTPGPKWRSGVKHDCAAVFELRRLDARLVNGLDEVVDVEEEYIFPLRKGSDVARAADAARDLSLVVPQRRVSDDLMMLATAAPRLWRYLSEHRDLLDRRASSIYRGRPPFSIFGVGAYTFAPWKVAICGLYKSFRFSVIGPDAGRPVLFDDTVYHLSFHSESEARRAAELLSTPDCQRLLESLVFWDAKRPVTIELLKRIDLSKVARHSGLEALPSLSPHNETASLF